MRSRHARMMRRTAAWEALMLCCKFFPHRVAPRDPQPHLYKKEEGEYLNTMGSLNGSSGLAQYVGAAFGE